MALPVAALAAGAILPAVGGIAKGMFSKKSKAPDLTPLFEMIAQSGAAQRDIINKLPDELKPLWDDYQKSNASASENLKTGTAGIGQDLMERTAANFGDDVVEGQINLLKKQTFKDLPEQQKAIREALAASGGLARGTTGTQLSKSVIDAYGRLSEGSADIRNQNLIRKQAATQQAIQTVASMDNQTVQNIFNLDKDQALQILTGSREDVKDQFTNLINQSQAELNAKLGVAGANIQNQFYASEANRASSNAQTGNIIDAITGGVAGAMSGIKAPTPQFANTAMGYSTPIAPAGYARAQGAY